MNVERVEPKDVACNLCGLSCSLGEPGHPAYEMGGLLRQIVRGGYSSTAGNGDGALDDGTSYRFSLCEFCLDWLFAQFKIPVETSDYSINFSEDFSARDTFDRDPVREPWEPAHVRVTRDEWRRGKEQFCEEAERRSIARSKR